MIHNIDLCQWDVGRTLTISDSEATHIHFANQGDSYAVIMYIDNGSVLIPDYLLQTGKTLIAYAVKNGVTLESKTFPVHKRERPADYVYEEDRRNYIYELIENAENAINNANEAADRANEAADKAGQFSSDFDSIQGELDNLRYDYEGNEYESAGEAVRGADITLNTRIQEVSDLAYTNAVEISILQETVENINPGSGGITDEELAEKVANIIATDVNDGGVINDSIYSVAESAAYSTAELVAQDYELLGVDEDGNLVRNVPTYEEMDEAVAESEAVIVTNSGATTSHSSQEIYALTQSKKVVYLFLDGYNYVRCTSSTETEAKFEDSYLNTIAAEDGKSYNSQRFRLFSIKNNTLSRKQADIPSAGYINAQIQHYLNL